MAHRTGYVASFVTDTAQSCYAVASQRAIQLSAGRLRTNISSTLSFGVMQLLGRQDMQLVNHIRVVCILHSE